MALYIQQINLNIKTLETFLDANKDRNARVKFVEGTCMNATSLVLVYFCINFLEKFPSTPPEKEMNDTFAMALQFCQKISKEIDLKEVS